MAKLRGSGAKPVARFRRSRLHPLGCGCSPLQGPSHLKRERGGHSPWQGSGVWCGSLQQRAHRNVQATLKDTGGQPIANSMGPKARPMGRFRGLVWRNPWKVVAGAHDLPQMDGFLLVSKLQPRADPSNENTTTTTPCRTHRLKQLVHENKRARSSQKNWKSKK